MPGDPLRAKFIAETFLEDPVQFNAVRGVLGYTGKYKGVEVSVMASGIGMPSMGIYSYELFKFYGVENIIRIGTTGAYTDKLELFDIVLADSVFTESSFAKTQCGYDKDTIQPSAKINAVIEQTAAELGIKIVKGLVHSSDVFYGEIPYNPYEEKGALCVEMESFALFSNARVLGKNAACILTISDSLVTHRETTAQQRQTAFTVNGQVFF
jgi:purine-nucleoside phosphorylase